MVEGLVEQSWRGSLVWHIAFISFNIHILNPGQGPSGSRSYATESKDRLHPEANKSDQSTSMLLENLKKAHTNTEKALHITPHRKQLSLNRNSNTGAVTQHHYPWFHYTGLLVNI